MTSSPISSLYKRCAARPTGGVRAVVAAALAVAGGVAPCWPKASRAAGDSSGGRPPGPSITVHASWRTFTTGDGLPHDSIRAISVFGDRVWVGTDGGLAAFDGGEWKSWTRSDGLPVDTVSAIELDPETHDAWLGTWGAGLVRFSGGRFDRFDQLNSGLAGDLVFDVAVFQGRVWAATSGGISAFEAFTNTWELYDPRKAYVADEAVMTFVTHDRGLYAGLWRGGVKRFHPAAGEWTAISTGLAAEPVASHAAQPKSALDPASSAVGIAAGGRTLWWATQEGVSRRQGSEGALDRPGSWRFRPIPRTNSPADFVLCLASPNDRQVWLGTNHGLLILADEATNTWVHLQSDGEGRGGRATIHLADGRVEGRRLPSAIPDNLVRCIAFDGDTAWVGTAKGLARGSAPASWATLPALVNELGPDTSIAGAKPAEKVAAVPTRQDAESNPGRPVAMAIYGPRNRTITLPGEVRGMPTEPDRPDLLAVELSLEQANDRGGFRGAAPFELVMMSPGYSRYNWGLPEDDIVFFSQDRRVMGIVGYLGPGQNVADAVVVRTEVPWVNVAPQPDAGGTTAGPNPWVFRCFGDEPRRHRLLLDYIVDRLGKERIALLGPRDRSTELRLTWWRTHAVERGHPLAADLEWGEESVGQAATLEGIQGVRAEAVVTWSGKGPTAEIIRRMRSEGMNQLVVVSPECVTEDFVELVGTDPGEVIALDPQSTDFVSRAGDPGGLSRERSSFAKRYADRDAIGRGRTEPDPNAYRSFAATDHLLNAVDLAGPDREGVRQVLEAMSRSPRGESHYERLLGATQIRFARLQNGRWVRQPIPPAGEEASAPH